MPLTSLNPTNDHRLDVIVERNGRVSQKEEASITGRNHLGRGNRKMERLKLLWLTVELLSTVW